MITPETNVTFGSTKIKTSFKKIYDNKFIRESICLCDQISSSNLGTGTEKTLSALFRVTQQVQGESREIRQLKVLAKWEEKLLRFFFSRYGPQFS